MLVEEDRTAAAIASTFLCSLLQWNELSKNLQIFL